MVCRNLLLYARFCTLQSTYFRQIHCNKLYSISNRQKITDMDDSDNDVSTASPTHPGQENLEKEQGSDKQPLSKRALKKAKKMKQIQRAKETKSQKRAEKKANSSRDLNFTEECLQETSYYMDNGLRKVYPYPFTFTTYAKGRWLGKKIEDVFLSEFRYDTTHSVKELIESGKVTVNGKKVEPEYIMKNQDFVENRIHRHEVPVTAEKLKIFENDEDIVVVSKPSSIPVHPCGRYRHNSVIYILAKEHGLRNLRILYRLDRLTSGLLLLGKNDQKTKEIMDAIKNRKVEKEYLCRVEGDFPSGVVECKVPLDVLSHKLGVFKVGPNGKESHTTFEKLSYNGMSSVVQCKPRTGRTHQIRIHLQYLGYPIINDPLYNSSVWGSNKGKGGHFGRSEEEVIKDLITKHSAENFIESELDSADAEIEEEMEQDSNNDSMAAEEEPSEDTNVRSRLRKRAPRDTDRSPSKGSPKAKKAKKDIKSPMKSSAKKEENSQVKAEATPSTSKVAKKEETSPVKSDTEEVKNGDQKPGATTKTAADSTSTFDPSKLIKDPECPECTKKHKDPRPEELQMFLHALKYRGPGWEYSTTLPIWAFADWAGDFT